jgi:hypothetical protein
MPTVIARRRPAATQKLERSLAVRHAAKKMLDQPYQQRGPVEDGR